MYMPPQLDDPLSIKAESNYIEERVRKGDFPLPGIDLAFTLLKIVFLLLRWLVRRASRLAVRLGHIMRRDR